jgi:zinc transporter 1/2/3
MEFVGESEESMLIKGILITLASGTFLYVVIVEILAEQFENGKFKYTKFFLGLLLFLAMSFVSFFEG